MSNQNQSQDRCYIAILGLSEHFKNSGDIKKAIQCLSALFTFNPPLKVEARTHLQLGQLYATYTQNHDLSLSHTEKAWMLSENINAFDDVKFDAANLLAKLYQNQNQTIKAKTVLRKAIEYSQHNIYWYSKFLFQIAQIHVSDKEYALASDLLSIGVDSSDENTSAYLKTQFILNRSMVLIIERKSNEVIVLLNQAATLIETIHNYHLKEYSRVFYLILQVSNSLQLGHVKSLKGILKQLQQIIQTIVSTPNWPSDEQIFGQNSTECFMWLPKEQLFVLVYVLTVSQSMISGFLEKTQKYTEKALTQIDKLKSQENKPILALFQVILLEHIAMCRLIMGNRLLAIKEISLAKDICMSSENKTLLKSHAPQLHCLLGLYAMSVNMFDKAEMQFMACTETTQRELKLFANLNLAIVYLRTNNDENLKKMLAHISADYSQPFSNQAMLGSYYWVQGLNAFQNNGFQEAKRFLRESLKMGNAEDLNRLTSCSLVLLSHVFLSIGNSKESMNMVVPAMQLASKIPDVNVQLWGSAILKDLHKMLGNQPAEQEALNQQVLYSQALQNDQFQCTKIPEHLLLNWTSNDPPAIMGTETEQFQPIAMPSTSHMNYGY